MNKETAKIFYAKFGDVPIGECINALKDRKRQFELDAKYMDLEIEILAKCFHGILYLVEGEKKHGLPYSEMNVIQNQLRNAGNEKNNKLVSHRHNIAYLDVIIKELEKLKEQKNNEEQSP